MPRFTLKINVFSSISLETHKYVLKPSEQALFYQDDQFEGSHAKVDSKYEHFPIHFLGNPLNVC